MPFTNTSAVQAALISWPNLGGSMTTAIAQDCMTLAEDRIYRELHVRSMETVISSTITASGTIAVPSDYVELIDAYVDGTPTQPLQRKSNDFILNKYPTRSSSGKPKFIARNGGNFVFGPYPDSTYLVYMTYYKKPTTAVGGTLSGILLNAPGLWLNASLCETEPYFGRDQRMALWEARYDAIKKAVMLEDEREKSSGPAPAMTAG